MEYFAYGSNMLNRRLRERVTSTEPIGKALLRNHHLAWHKISVDGSAKCYIVENYSPNSYVWGVLYSINETQKTALDKAEGLGKGYAEKTVTVQCGAKGYQATTYYATRIDSTLLPYHGDKQYVVLGAQENELPGDYIQQLSSTPSMDDLGHELQIMTK